ncbi:MAG: replication restart helicase PriA [Planctomycetota bacterium]|jgi:primosomal protein N' (replication factor Y)
MASCYVKVAVDIPFGTTFTYRVPEALEGKLECALRVRVPFGRRERVGYVCELMDAPDCHESKIKDILTAVDKTPLFTPRLVELLNWISEYYACPLFAAFEAAIPTGIKKGSQGKQINIVNIAAGIEKLTSLRAETKNEKSARAKMLDALIVRAGEGEVTVPQNAIVSEAGTSASPLNTLAKEGVVEIVKESAPLDTAVGAARGQHTVRGEITLTPAQEKARDAILKAIDEEQFRAFLLHGVTGSGKTEVYLDAIERIIERGKQAIVLVPEISLTPQTVSRFAVRFERLALLHSQQTEALRREMWRKIAAGEADVIIGPQSAVFAPVPSLGLIVVDEEHEPSFKNLASPRYHARDVAVMRAKLSECPIVLGSATPDLVTYHNATTARKYGYLHLPDRVTEQSLPGVRIIDMGAETRREHRRVFFSRELLNRLRDAVAQKEQALLFLNRRGYQPFVRCRNHGDTVRCPRCSVALTYHRNEDALVCHYCSRRSSASHCPECYSTDLIRFGLGTERVEEILTGQIPGIRCARMDTDTMRRREEYDRVLGEFRAGNMDCLVGTQMIAKGLDFPNVTLVGVLAADQILDFPDFRAAERTFQLLVQVAGRAGRGRRRGTVIVQTWNPDHPVILFSAQHNYDSFAKHELAARKPLAYPPFSRLVRFVISAPVRDTAEKHAASLNRRIRQAVHEFGLPVDVLPASPTPRRMLRGRYQFHFLTKSRTTRATGELIAALEGQLHPGKDTRVTIDVDPVTMF